MKKKVFRERYAEFEIPEKEHNEIKEAIEEVLETAEIIESKEIEVEVEEKPKKRGRKNAKSSK